MNTCKTCVHWVPELDQDGRIKESRVLGGDCISHLIGEDYGRSAFTEKSLVYSYAEGGSFWTGPDFGCVNHEHKT